MGDFLLGPPFPPRVVPHAVRGLPPSHFYFGLDLGQRQDHSALAIVEHRHIADGPFDWAQYVQPLTARLYVRDLVRFPLHIPYPQLVGHIRRKLMPFAAKHASTLAIDATGVGAPIVDLFRESRLPCAIQAVQITGGSQTSRAQDGLHRVPKRDLIATLVVLLEQQHLKIARSLPSLELLRRELHSFRVHTNANGHDRYGASGSREHDDLLLALALACYLPQREIRSLSAPARSNAYTMSN